MGLIPELQEHNLPIELGVAGDSPVPTSSRPLHPRRSSADSHTLKTPTRSSHAPSLEEVLVDPAGLDVLTHSTSENAASVGFETLHLVEAHAVGIPSTPESYGPKAVTKIGAPWGKQEGGDDYYTSRTANLEEIDEFWRNYNKMAERELREFVRAIGGTLNTLLIFAGLFSAVNTAFIIESMRILQPDQVAKTNDLIRSVILVLQNSTTTTDLHCNTDFAPSPQGTRGNAMFLASLCCALTVTFGAFLGVQWLNYYEREPHAMSSHQRGREHYKKHESRAQWHFEDVIESLLDILLISHFLFLAGLIEFLRAVHQTNERVVLVFTLVLAFFYTIATVVATIYPHSPFQTRVSIRIRTIYKGTHSISRSFLDSLPKFKSPAFLPHFKLRFPSSLTSHLNPKPLVITATNAILDLKCSIHHAEMISENDERGINQLSAVLDTLPVDLELDPNHPILVPLGEVVLKFFIKPSATRRNPASTLIVRELPRLLKALHLLYSSWKHLDGPLDMRPASLYFSEYRLPIWRGLWDVFARNPRDLVAASLIGDIFDLLPPLFSNERIDQQNLEETQETLVPIILDDPDKWPYIKLLGASLDSTNDLKPSYRIDMAKLVPILLSSFDEIIAEENALQSVWAEVLPGFLEETMLDLTFSKYLVRCCSAHLFDEGGPYGQGRSRNERQARLSDLAHLRCLRAVYKLLHQNPDSSLWPQTFEDDGFPSLLLQISRQSASGTNRGIVCLCFISLWRRAGLLNSPTTPQPSPLRLSSTTVATIAQTLKYINEIKSEHLDGIGEEHISQTMKDVVEYFEEASIAGMLKHSMEADIAGYKLQGYCHGLLEEEVRRGLYEQIDKFVYT